MAKYGGKLGKQLTTSGRSEEASTTTAGAFVRNAAKLLLALTLSTIVFLD